MAGHGHEVADDEQITFAIRVIARKRGSAGASDKVQTANDIADREEIGRRSADPLIRSLLDDMHAVAVRLDRPALWALWAQAAYNLADDLRLRDPAAARAALAEMHKVARRRNEALLWHLYDKTRAVLDVVPEGQVLFEDEYDLPMPGVLPDTDIPIVLTAVDSREWRKAKRWLKGPGDYRSRSLQRGRQDGGQQDAPPAPDIRVSPMTMSGDSGDGHAVAKIRRNDPCPCGSGKKYKWCHGATG